MPQAFGMLKLSKGTFGQAQSNFVSQTTVRRDNKKADVGSRLKMGNIL